MKKFYSFLFAAVALVGFAACNSDNTEEPAPAGVEKVSFKANIDTTKTDLDEDNKTIWENDDVIMIGKYPFTTTDGEEFTCNQTGCSELLNKEVEAVYSHNGDGKIDSKAGKAGSVLTATGMLTAEGGEFNFAVTSAFLHVKATGAFTMSADKNIFYYDGAEANTISFEAGDHYVAINPTVNVEFSYTVGEETKTKSVEKFEACKIYALDAQEYTTVYLVPGAWANDNARFAVYTINNQAWVNMIAAEGKAGVYTCELPVNTTGLIFVRMNPNVAENRWNENSDTEETKPVWNQTVDLTLPTEEGENFFYFETWDNGEGKSTGNWGVDPYAPETPDVASNWCVAGAFNGWGDTNVMVTTTVKNLFVAKNISLKAYTDEFKIKVKGTWDGSYGAGEVCYVNKNSNVAAFVGSNTNFAAVEAGAYDIYFEALSGSVYLMVAGTDYTTATKQTANGPMPDTSSMKWGLCGAHNSWGTPDIPLTWDGTIGMYVAKSATLNGDFKVRADEDWATSFGSGGTVTANKAAATTVYNNGGNSKATGTYDVYFWYNKDNIKANGKIWIKTPGSAAPTL